MEKEQIIEDIFSRGIGTFLDPEGAFKEKLLKKIKGEYEKDIVIKLGADPTRPDLHLGHAVVLRKLKKLQELGCKVVFVVGDFTTLLGDPTGKSKARPKVQLDEKLDNTSTRDVSADVPLNVEEGSKNDAVPGIPTSIEIAKNMETYIDQITRSGILDTDGNSFSWIRNSDWFLSPVDINYGPEAKASMNVKFNKDGVSQDLSVPILPNSFLGKTILFQNTRMQTKIKPNDLTLISLRGLLWTLQHVTFSKLIDRDMFQERINNGDELYMHEMLYPVIQGIDSYSIARIYGSCDLEVGGTDQTFNILMGLDVLYANHMEPQAVLTFKVLEGTDGKEKMSKSLDNYIGITDAPADMYGKVMSIPDSSILSYFELCTYTPYFKLEEIKQQLTSGEVNPKNLKMELARQIVAEYHGEAASQAAENDFVTKFQKKEIPEEIPEITGEGMLADVLVSAGLVASKSEFRRLVEGGAVTNLDTGEKITDPAFEVTETVTLKIGKMTFVRVKV